MSNLLDCVLHSRVFTKGVRPVSFACSQLQQDLHEQSLASNAMQQELDSKSGHLDSLQQQNRQLIDSKVCRTCMQKLVGVSKL